MIRKMSMLLALAVVVSFAANANAILTTYAIQISPGNGSNDNDVNNTTEARAIHDAVRDQLGLGAGAGVVTVGPTTYNVTTNVRAIQDRTDWAGTSNHNFTPNESYPGVVAAEDFIIAHDFRLWLPQGDYTVNFQSDDGYSTVWEGVTWANKGGNGQPQGAADELRFEAPTGNSNSGGQFSVGPGGQAINVWGLFWERGGGDYGEMSIIDSHVAPNPGNANTAGFVIIEDGAVLENGTVLHVSLKVPEPATATLALLGLAGLARRRRRTA